MSTSNDVLNAIHNVVESILLPQLAGALSFVGNERPTQTLPSPPLLSALLLSSPLLSSAALSSPLLSPLPSPLLLSSASECFYRHWACQDTFTELARALYPPATQEAAAVLAALRELKWVGFAPRALGAEGDMLGGADMVAHDLDAAVTVATGLSGERLTDAASVGVDTVTTCWANEIVLSAALADISRVCISLCTDVSLWRQIAPQSFNAAGDDEDEDEVDPTSLCATTAADAYLRDILLPWLLSALWSAEDGDAVEQCTAVIAERISLWYRMLPPQCATGPSFFGDVDTGKPAGFACVEEMFAYFPVIGNERHAYEYVIYAKQAYDSLRHQLMKVILQCRCDKAFEIIRDFPDSKGALEDVRQCIDVLGVDGASMFAQAVSSALTFRLLHEGAATQVIIEFLITTVRALDVADPSHSCAVPLVDAIAAYLRGRSDTVSTIVRAMTMEEGNELHAELLNAKNGGAGNIASSIKRVNGVSARDPDDEDYDSELEEGAPTANTMQDEIRTGQTDWSSVTSLDDRSLAFADLVQPIVELTSLSGEPKRHEVIAWRPASLQGLSKKYLPGNGKELIPLMISIVGNEEPFITEYRNILARLLFDLSPRVWDTDKEDTLLELLKMRFGDGNLHIVEIMMRDFLDSKRLSKEIQSRLPEDLKAGAAPETLILSHHYWPPLSKDEPEIHPSLLEIFEVFKEQYGVVRKPRHLGLLPQEGQVELEVTLPSGDVADVMCSLLQASFLLYVRDEATAAGDEIRISTISAAMNMSVPHVLKLATFWEGQNCIRVTVPSGADASAAVISLSAISDSGNTGARLLAGEETTQEHSGDSAEAVATWVSFIVGMLTNLGSLPIERIHSNLTLFASMGEYPFEKTTMECAKLLGKLVASKQIVLLDGLYRLP